MCLQKLKKDTQILKKITNYFCVSVNLVPRTSQPGPMQPAETQEQPETPDPLHHLPAPLPGEEVPSETVPLHRGAGRVLQLPEPHRDPGQDLVSEPPGQGQETARGRAGEDKAGLQAAAPGLRLPLPSERTGSLRGSERTWARPVDTGTFQ